MPDSDLEHQTLHFLHSWRPWSPLRQRGMWWEQMRMGGSWTAQSRTFWGWTWARSSEEAKITIALDCSLGRLSGAGIFERSLSGSERLSFLFRGTIGNAVLLVFSLLGTRAPASEQPLETSPDLGPTTPVLPTRAPELEQVHFWYFFYRILNVFMI